MNYEKIHCGQIWKLSRSSNICIVRIINFLKGNYVLQIIRSSWNDEWYPGAVFQRDPDMIFHHWKKVK